MTPNISVACRDGKENDSAHSASIFTCLSAWQGLARSKTSLMTCADTSLKTSANAARKRLSGLPPAFPKSVNRNRNEHQKKKVLLREDYDQEVEYRIGYRVIKRVKKPFRLFLKISPKACLRTDIYSYYVSFVNKNAPPPCEIVYTKRERPSRLASRGDLPLKIARGTRGAPAP